MRFILTRTSTPHEVQIDDPRVSSGEVMQINIINVQPMPGWYERGTNHRQLSDGRYARDLGMRTVRFIDLDTLDDLVAFVHKYGRVIVDRSFINPALMELEIYDDYRE